MLDKQKILGKAWDHFIVHDGVPGYDVVSGRCSYGSIVDAERCAIGIFDDDGVLSTESGGVDSVHWNLLHHVFGKMGLVTPDVDATTFLDAIAFLKSLQVAHDVAVTEARDRMPPDSVLDDLDHEFPLETFKTLFKEKLLTLGAVHNLQLPSV